MKNLFIKLRGADIKEIEIFMLLVTVWFLILFAAAFFFPSSFYIDVAVTLLINKFPVVAALLFSYALLITILGTITYLGKFARFIGPWLFLSGLFWGSLSLIMLIFQPFTLIFGIYAFLTTTSFHLFTLQIKERIPKVLCRKCPEDRRNPN